MQRNALLLLGLLVLPAVSFGQRGGGTRSQADKHTPMMDDKGASKGPTLRVRDVEDMSPIRRLIDKHKDLKLSDAQVDRLKESEMKLKQRDEPLLKTVDSLVHEIKVASSSDNAEAKSRAREAMIALRGALLQIQENYDAAATEATSSFDPEQQAKSKEILAKLKEDNDNMLKDRLSMGQRQDG
jgi:hypothetical protein